MAIVEYLKSLLTVLGISPDRLPMVIGLISAGIALLYARPFFGRLGRIIEAVFLRNWQLGLLGATGLVLSLASGWTTWDGMKNFTGEPILSAMVTFGIQGVMLIVAWLIGESFATGMNQQVPAGKLSTQGVSRDTGLKSALGLTLIGIAVLGGAGTVLGLVSGGPDPGRVAWWLAAVGGVLIVAGLLIVAARAHTFRGYFDATRVIVRTAVLWVMFLACMGTSVFFSFDSLFSTIFPASERVRAAELRAQNQVAGIINDIGATITNGQLKETEELFKSKAWFDYDKQLSTLTTAANESKTEIEKYFQKLMEDKRTAIAEQQGRMTTAQSSQVGLASKKLNLTDELARLKSERPSLAEDYSKRKSDVDQIMKDIDAKRVEAMAESRGVEGTLKSGEGPIFRQRKAEEAALKDKLKIGEERLRDAQKRFQTVETRLTQIERELTLVDGDIAKLKGEAQTAEQRIKLAEEAKTAEEGVNLDPTRQIPAFEKARAEFRQTPKIESLAHVQSMCNQLLTAMAANPAVKGKVGRIDCDPKTAAEAASRVFALNAGIVAFDTNCAGGDKLSRYKSADDLFGFARKCVQDSGLASKDTDDLRQKINFIELNRDDKANRFVVTWNAFQDGNRLAYLSLAIAIAIDSLVFMSGLFGANAVRSPLSDVPTTKARSAEQLEGIIDNALLPHRFENARIAIEAMHADTSVPGYTAVVDLQELDPQSATVVRRVLNAGATIGAVLRNTEAPTQYAIRPELYEYLAITGARAFEKHGKLVQEDVAEKVRQGELEKMVRVALLPDEMENADTVLHYAHPMNESDGFMSQIILREVEPDHVRVVRRVLNAGAAHGAVRIQKGTDEAGSPHPYELHADLYKTLSKIRARMLLGSSQQALRIGQQPQDGGRLRELNLQISSQAGTKSLSGSRPSGATRTENIGSTDPAGRTQKQEPKFISMPQLRAIDSVSEASGIDQTLLDHIVQYPQPEAAASLQRAVDAVRQCDAGLDQLIVARERQITNSLMMVIAKNPDSEVQKVLDVIKQHRSIILLRENGAYEAIIDFAIDELRRDEADAGLSYPDRNKLQVLLRHRSALKQAQLDINNWAGSLADTLNRFATELAKVEKVSSN